MIEALLYAYLAGWVVTTAVLAVTVRRLQDSRQPSPHPLLTSIVAGAAWPILAIGAAEMATVAIATDVLHEEEDEPGLLVEA